MYFDETSMHAWQTQKKAWCAKDQRLRIPVTQMRGKGWTVFGTISDALEDNGYFEIHESTNSEAFLSYMTNLKDKIRPECAGKRLVMCLDNHKAHKGYR